jgi:hypothetical protein
MGTRKTSRPAGWGLLGAWGLAIVAIGCCAGGPLLAGLAGSVAIGSVLGLVAAGVALAVVVAVIAVRYRRRIRAHRSTIQRF